MKTKNKRKLLHKQKAKIKKIKKLKRLNMNYETL